MATLYVTTPGAHIEKDYGRLRVIKDDESLASVPLNQVSEVVTIGSVGMTLPAMLAVLSQGANLSIITPQGRLLGRLIAAEARNLPLRHTQYARSQDADFCLRVARVIVVGKLKNSRTMMRRMARAADELAQTEPTRADAQAEAVELRGFIRRARSAVDLATLRGIEGAAAKVYFGALKRALGAEFKFQKRARRPPSDPANALLSLAYALLMRAVFSACEVAGLDAYDGFLHADKYGRPALALDLMEEFRSIVADSAVLRAVNQGSVHATDFEYDDAPSAGGGMRLRPAALRRFVNQFSRRLNTPVMYAPAGRAIAMHKIIEAQAWAMRRAIEQNDPDSYTPFLPK